MDSKDEKIILFHYEQSIYSHRVVWYMNLAGIPYSECIQPPIMPRPDLAELGVAYRRIPILSIGKHVYCDSRLILETLQKRYPLGNSDLGIQKLFQFWNVDQVFMHAARCLPFERSAFARDPAFLADRAEATGNAFQIEDIIKARPESYAYIRSSFEVLESFFADGREWVLGGPKLSLADIEAVFVAQWLITDPLMEGAIPEEYLSESLFPKTYAWARRFKDVVNQAGIGSPKPKTLSGKEAFEVIMNSPDVQHMTRADGPDPLGLEVGQMVEIYPTDWASNHHDRGELVNLNINEVCIKNDRGIFIHFPRWNFRVQAFTEKPTTGPNELSEAKKTHRLMYHPMSPYSRKVYMLALELGLQEQLELQKVVVAPVKYPGWSDDVDALARSNPLAKIPTLVIGEDENGIYDSRVICEFLEEEAKSARGTSNWRLKALHACADGIMDAQVLIFYEKKIRGENKVRFEPWIIGQQEKITRGLDRLEFEASRGTLQPAAEGKPVSAAEVAVVACMGFMDVSGSDWRNGRTKLADWFQRWQKRDSFVKTIADVDWKTGEKSDIGFARQVLDAQGS